MAGVGGRAEGKEGAWDSFEDLMRAVTFPRKTQFYKQAS